MTEDRSDLLAESTPEALLELHDLFGRMQTDSARLRETLLQLGQVPLAQKLGVDYGAFGDMLARFEISAIGLRINTARLIPKVAVNGRNRQLQRIEDTVRELAYLMGVERGDEGEAA